MYVNNVKRQENAEYLANAKDKLKESWWNSNNFYNSNLKHESVKTCICVIDLVYGWRYVVTWKIGNRGIPDHFVPMLWEACILLFYFLTTSFPCFNT